MKTLNIGIFVSKQHRDQTWHLIDLFKYEMYVLPLDSNHIINAGSHPPTDNVYYFWISDQLLTLLALTHTVTYYTSGLHDLEYFEKLLYDS